MSPTNTRIIIKPFKRFNFDRSEQKPSIETRVQISRYMFKYSEIFSEAPHCHLAIFIII